MSKAMRRQTVDRAIQVYEAIRQHIAEHGHSPTLRGLMAVTDMKSTATVTHYLHILKSWGWVNWISGTQGTLHLTRVTERIHVVEKPRRKAKAVDVA